MSISCVSTRVLHAEMLLQPCHPPSRSRQSPPAPPAPGLKLRHRDLSNVWGDLELVLLNVDAILEVGLVQAVHAHLRRADKENVPTQDVGEGSNLVSMVCSSCNLYSALMKTAFSERVSVACLIRALTTLDAVWSLSFPSSLRIFSRPIWASARFLFAASRSFSNCSAPHSKTGP